jgi:DNA-binding response OmpR family regulator
MNKVLLVYEDYSEMMTIQSVLKKVGFDVVTAGSEFSLAQQVLSFNPDIIVGYGKGPKVSTVGVGRRLKEMPRWSGKVVLIFPAGLRNDPAELAKVRMDMALEAPLEVTRLLQVLANLTNQDPRALIETMMKAVAQEAETQNRTAGNAAQAKVDDAVFVSGSREAPESWNVKGTKEIEDFNQLMGVNGAPAANSTVPGAASGNPAGSAPAVAKPAPKFPLTPENPTSVGSSSATPDSDIARVSAEGPITSETGPAVTNTAAFPLEGEPGLAASSEAEKAAAELKAAEEALKNSPSEMVTGGGASTDASAVTGVASDLETPTSFAALVQQQLQQAGAKIAEKVKGYERFLKETPLSPVSAHKRTEVRKAQKVLKDGWTDEGLKTQDELRRQATNELFKKKD